MLPLAAACGGGAAQPSTSLARSAAARNRAASVRPQASRAPATPRASQIPDANGFQRMTAIPVPPGVTNGGTLAYDPDTKSLYLDLPGSLAVVDTTKKVLETTVPAASNSGGITFDQQYVYIASPVQSHIESIHKGDWSVEPAVDAPSALSGGIWSNPPRNSLYALTQQGELLVYTAGASPKLSATYNIGAAGPGTFVSSTNTLYVAAPGQVTALDVASGQSHSAPLQDASAITGLAYDDRTGLLWATAEDHHLIVLDGQSLQASQMLDAPSSSAIGFDGRLRFIYTFGAGGFGAYDTNFTLQSAQVDTGDAASSDGAVDPIDDYVYTYEPVHHQLGVYSWGAHGNSYVGPGGGGGTASSSGGAGGGGAGNGGGVTGSGGITTTSGASSSAAGAPNGSGSGSAAANSSPSGFGAPSSAGAASGVSSTGTGSSSAFGSSSTSGSAGSGSTATGPSSGASSFGGSGSSTSSGSTTSTANSSAGTSGGSGGGGAGTGGSTGSQSSPTSSPGSTTSLPAAPAVPPSTSSVPTSPKA